MGVLDVLPCLVPSLSSAPSSLTMDKISSSQTFIHGMRERTCSSLKAQPKSASLMEVMTTGTIQTCLSQLTFSSLWSISISNSLSFLPTLYGFQERATLEFTVPTYLGKSIITTNAPPSLMKLFTILRALLSETVSLIGMLMLMQLLLRLSLISISFLKLSLLNSQSTIANTMLPNVL